MAKPNWPSREEWAKEQRTAYWDRYPEVSDAIADYATPEEVAALKEALRERWKFLGREMRKSNDLREDVAKAHVAEIRYQRRRLNYALKMIERGQLPYALEDRIGAKDIIAPFVARLEAAKAELYRQAEERIAQTPIDDRSWEKELRRRSSIERSMYGISRVPSRELH